MALLAALGAGKCPPSGDAGRLPAWGVRMRCSRFAARTLTFLESRTKRPSVKKADQPHLSQTDLGVLLSILADLGVPLRPSALEVQSISGREDVKDGCRREGGPVHSASGDLQLRWRCHPFQDYGLPPSAQYHRSADWAHQTPCSPLPSAQGCSRSMYTVTDEVQFLLKRTCSKLSRRGLTLPPRCKSFAERCTTRTLGHPRISREEVLHVLRG